MWCDPVMKTFLLFLATAGFLPLAPSLVHASSCSDFTDPDDCTDHKYLGVHTCSYCETQRECHEVGSVYDDCANECCASHATLSVCEASTYEEIDHRSCSGWVNATVWQNTGTDYTWPEQTAGATNGAGVALLFSGGGARAYTCAMGQVRALTAMGLMDGNTVSERTTRKTHAAPPPLHACIIDCNENHSPPRPGQPHTVGTDQFEYIASSSGGSWFSSVYTYYQAIANTASPPPLLSQFSIAAGNQFSPTNLILHAELPRTSRAPPTTHSYWDPTSRPKISPPRSSR